MRFQTILTAAMATMVPMAAAGGQTGKLIVKFVELFAPGTDHQHNPSIDTRDADFDLFRRQEAQLPPGIPQNVIDDCKKEGEKAAVEVTRQGSGGLEARKVPAVCMFFATYWTDATSPHPCGNDCLKYEGLNATEVQTVLNAAKELMPNVKLP